MSDEQGLELLSERLGCLILRPDAECYYDLLAGAVVWMDERPSLDDLGRFHIDCLNALRRVWFIRTARILGEDLPQDESYWVKAKRLFPAWPGFAPERCAITLRNDVANLREQSQSQFTSDWEGLLDPCPPLSAAGSADQLIRRTLPAPCPTRSAAQLAAGT